MHGVVVATVVAVLVAHVGIHDVTANPALSLPDFPSPYLDNTALLPLLKTHIELSLNQLLTSKQYGGQYVQRPGLAKLLAAESDRHWEEGISVLKKYLQIGGKADTEFKGHFNFEGKGELDLTDLTRMNMKYLTTMTEMMKTSRSLVTKLTDYHHLAIQRQNTENNGDVDVAHFLAEQAEKEAAMAHKMASSCTTFNSIKNSGVAVNMFDQHI